MTPRYIVVRCSWCRGDHWHVVPNVLTSRGLAARASFTSLIDAEADAAARSAAWAARRPKKK